MYLDLHHMEVIGVALLRLIIQRIVRVSTPNAAYKIKIVYLIFCQITTATKAW